MKKDDIYSNFKRLAEDTRGNIVGLAGIMMPTIVLVSMTAIDISMTYNIKNKMQNSVDASILAASLDAHSLPKDATDEEIQETLEATFENYYTANFAGSLKSTEDYVLTSEDYTLSYDREAKKVTVDVKYDHEGVASLLVASYGKQISVNSTTKLSVVEDHYIIDLVMCIDATGSMQNTLDAVKASASTFNTDLRAAMAIPSSNLKIRVRPMFYRDWDDEYYYQHRNTNVSPWGSYWASWWNNYINSRYGGWDNYEGGLVMYQEGYGNGFIDLDPNLSSGTDSDAQLAIFKDFIGSEVAARGQDIPEAAGACLNEGIRSEWYDNKSDEAKEYFDIPDSHTIIDITEAEPVGDYSRITTVPVIVFWTDAPISSLYTTKSYISSTTPTSYSSFEQLWENEDKINQELKLMIHFGPNSGQGWNNVKTWDRYKFGGSLNVGNAEGVARIAEEITDSVPSLLGLSF